MDRDLIVETLHQLARKHLHLFHILECEEVYGLGFYYDEHDWLVYLVANTVEFHRDSFAKYLLTTEAHCDEDSYRWNIGNWKYPGGLFPSASAEQMEFDRIWKEAVHSYTGERSPGTLYLICSAVLEMLAKSSELKSFPGLVGLTVLDECERDVIKAKGHFGRLIEQIRT